MPFESEDMLLLQEQWQQKKNSGVIKPWNKPEVKKPWDKNIIIKRDSK